MRPPAVDPQVSIVIAARNAAATLDEALWSARRQTLREIEVIVVDDASSDGTSAIVERHAAVDPRVRCVSRDRAGGPAAARNAGLEAATGRFVAILDSDDLMHPERLARLVSAAEQSGADIVGDEMIAFAGPPGRRSAWRFLRIDEPAEIDLPGFLAANVLGRGTALGYLKPLIRTATLRRLGLRYDERLRIGEDYALIAGALAKGARLRLVPEPTYFYRRHAASISQRLRPEDIEALRAADARLESEVPPGPETRRAFAARRASLERAARFSELVSQIKARDFRAAAASVREQPVLALDLARAAAEGLVRRAQRALHRDASPEPGAVVIVSRQRLPGAVNGSSAYLLALAEALRRAGHHVDLVVPSPAALGRWPWMRLSPAMDVFRRIRMRGTARIGPWIINLQPVAWWAAARFAVAKAFGRLGWPTGWLGVRPAPYAIAAPWRPADFRAVTRWAGHATALVADYAFQLEALPFALRPDVPRLVVMHDLFHRREAQFTAQGAKDSVAHVTEAEERNRLAAADVIVAIQADEARWAESALPDAHVVVAPMVQPVVPEPQPGLGTDLLFVGSNTAPNVVALDWCLEHIWPHIRRARPEATLTIVGSVTAARPQPTDPQIRWVGPVESLAPWYSQAAVVLSPLTAGSGLKIKLVEALAHGKAIVATSVTLQGVEEIVGDAVRVADDPTEFAVSVIGLLNDTADRTRLAAAALACARAHFGPDALDEFLHSLRMPGTSAPAAR